MKVKENIKELTKKIFTTRILIFIASMAILFAFIFKDFLFDSDSYIIRIFASDYVDNALSFLIKILIVLLILFGFTSIGKILVL